MSRVLGIVLAGGQGHRLWPLTADRAKPAVPFGGGYRLIDFVLSNLVNGGIHQLYVLTQYKSHSLDQHVATAWSLPGALGAYLRLVPAQQRTGPNWYAGSADAIRQAWHLVADAKPDYVMVFSSDHVYRMDPAQMLDQHRASGAGATVAAIRVPRAQASSFGCIESTAAGRVIRFTEKPDDPPRTPDDPDTTLVSMGNYVFSTPVLGAAVHGHFGPGAPVADMGGDVLPELAARGLAGVYDFDANRVAGATERDHGYWRDIGTLDAYYQANLDLVAEDPVFNLDNRQWPIRTADPALPPVRFLAGGRADSSILGNGSLVIGGSITGSVISTDVIVDHGAVVRDSVLLPGVRVGKGAMVSNAILDKNCVVEYGAQVGTDAAGDSARHVISPAGIVIVRKGTLVRERRWETSGAGA